MDVKLVRIGVDEAESLWKMQVKAFGDLYEKYQDTETSPATEKVEKMIMRLNQPFTYYYYIVSAKYFCGFPNPLVSSIIVGERYLDYFTTMTEDRLWQLLAKPVSRWRNRSGLSMNAARAA